MTGKLTVHKPLAIKGLGKGLAGIDPAINEARCYANTIKVHEEMIASRGRERKIKMPRFKATETKHGAWCVTDGYDSDGWYRNQSITLFPNQVKVSIEYPTKECLPINLKYQSSALEIANILNREWQEFLANPE